MEETGKSEDLQAIEAIIARQFGSLSWSPGNTGDWEKFSADFFPDASLYPAARPPRCQTVPAFVERMKGLAESDLQRFDEELLGAEIRVFGNVAVAVAACRITENGSDVSRGVEMMLLVKDEGQWRIVSQAWDTESPSNPIPDRLLAGTSGG